MLMQIIPINHSGSQKKKKSKTKSPKHIKEGRKLLNFWGSKNNSVEVGEENEGQRVGIRRIKTHYNVWNCQRIK